MTREFFPEPARWVGDMAQRSPVEVTTMLTREEAASLARCEAVIERTIGSFMECGEALMEISTSRLYKATHRTFDSYVRERWGMGANHARRLIRSVQIVADIKEGQEEMGPRGPILPLSEKQVRPLAKLDAEERREGWQQALDRAGGKQPTARQVKDAVDEIVAQHKPLAGQTSFLNGNGKNTFPGLDGPAFPPKPGEVRPFKNWEAFILDLNNQELWIREHGGVKGYTQGWNEQQLTFIRENLKRFRAVFDNWIQEFEGRPS